MYETTDGKVGVNTTAPVAKLGVESGEDSVAVHGLGTKTGIYGYADNELGSYAHDTVYGVFGEANEGVSLTVGVGGRSVYESSSGAVNTGIYGTSANSMFGNIGVTGAVNFDHPDALNIGVYGKAELGHDNYGGKFEAVGEYGTNYGIYAEALGWYGGYFTSDFYAGYFEGDIAHTGSIIYVSDSTLKSNVTNVTDALSVISRLQPKSYEYKTADFPQMNLPDGLHYGLIAQEVDAVLPEIVKDIITPAKRDSSGNAVNQKTDFKGINYISLIPLLIGGMNEQQAVIAAQQTTIDSLSRELGTRLSEIESRLDNCCRTGTEFKMENPEESEETSVHRHSVELNSLQVVVLEQNVPNPFAEQTSISYFIPDDAGRAQMHFTDFSGRVIRTVELEKGSGILTVFAQNLSSGTYSYSLIIDGKVIETKRMIKTK